jgi:hypothetical protein
MQAVLASIKAVLVDPERPFFVEALQLSRELYSSARAVPQPTSNPPSAASNRAFSMTFMSTRTPAR